MAYDVMMVACQSAFESVSLNLSYYLSTSVQMICLLSHTRLRIINNHDILFHLFTVEVEVVELTSIEGHQVQYRCIII